MALYRSPYYQTVFESVSLSVLERKFLLSFKSIGLLVQEKKRKIDFKDGRHYSYFGFQIWMILAIFEQQITPMLPTEFQVNWPIDSGEEPKNKLVIFDLQVAPLLPI